jgi:hypothetical protein
VIDKKNNDGDGVRFSFLYNKFYPSTRDIHMLLCIIELKEKKETEEEEEEKKRK